MILEILEMAGVEIIRPGESGFEDFCQYWHLNQSGEGPAFCCPNAGNQNAYLSIGPASDLVTVDVYFDWDTDGELWSRWGTRFSEWCNENWAEALDRATTQIARYQ